MVDPCVTRTNPVYVLRLTDTMTGIAANEPNFPLVKPDFCGLPERTLACNLNSAGLKCRGLIEISMVQVFERVARRGEREKEKKRERKWRDSRCNS